MNYVEALLPDVMFRASDVPDTILRSAIRDGVREFLRESEVWRPEIEPVYTFGDINRFEIFLPWSARIARVYWVRVENRELDFLDTSEFEADQTEGCLISNHHPHELMLTSVTPRGWVTLAAALTPNADEDCMPEHLIHDFKDPLVASALLRIYGMPGNGWFSEEIAGYYQATLRNALLRGKRLVNNRRKEQRRTVKYGGL